MRKYRSKKIWVSPKNFVIVRLYDNKKDMQAYYKCARPYDKNHGNCLGVHMGHVKYRTEKGKTITNPEIGMVLLNREHCGVGVVSHELLHAVLWGWRFHKNKKQHPIIIKSMKEEEELLLRHTKAVANFYRWFWTINEEVKRYGL